jgi:SAM-dependent methyltransferase
MDPKLSVNSSGPGVDQRPLWDVLCGGLVYNAVLVAQHLKLFPLLATGPRTTSEVCEALQIEHRPATSLLSTCTAAGLLAARDGAYQLTPLAEAYLVETSPYYFGSFLDMLIATDEVLSFEALKQATLTNKSQVYGGDDPFMPKEEMLARVRGFINGMHGHSAGAAFSWPALVDLADCETLLDVGGGSGAHSIGAASRWPNLNAVIFDLPPVCEIAQEFIARAGLQNRVSTHVGDLWNDPFPQADAHFYADIFHDWSPEKCRFLTKKSFESLKPGGRILLLEMLYDDDKAGPLMTAAYSVAMMLWTEGQQYTGSELRAMLSEAGFAEIEVKPSFGYWSLITGLKP